LRIWWKIRKPTTFGVKVLLIHPDDPAQCLIVRHSYSDSGRWGIPGGGYRPGRETPGQALEGKRDMVTLVQAKPVSASFVRSPEIAEARWVRADMAAMPAGEPVSRWLERAFSAHNAPGRRLKTMCVPSSDSAQSWLAASVLRALGSGVARTG
jgi:8-oxo-dGTP diphosphatase